MPARSMVRHGDAFRLLAKMPRGHVDHVLTDPPYAEVVHKGHNAARSKKARNKLDFDSLTPGQAAQLAELFDRVTRGWIVVLTDHILGIAWEDAFRSLGRYVFPPLPLVTLGGRVRMQGDGPSSWMDSVIVSRPRTKEAAAWRTTVGAYIATRDRDAMTGAKPLSFCRELVRDYSNVGDTILDPFAGSGTMGHAALDAGRVYRGIEIDKKRARAANDAIRGHGRNLTLWRR